MNIKEQALQEYQEENVRIEQQTNEREIAVREENIRQLIERIQNFFGEEVEFEVVYNEDTDQQQAVLKDIPEAKFSISRTTPQYLTMSPNLVIPEGDAYDEWWDNPLNCNRPEWAQVRHLKDVGYNLTLWQEADWTIYPWTEKEQPKEIKTKCFDSLNLAQANDETRPFKVLAAGVDEGYEYLIVEYLDIKEE